MGTPMILGSHTTGVAGSVLIALAGLISFLPLATALVWRLSGDARAPSRLIDHRDLRGLFRGVHRGSLILATAGGIVEAIWLR